MIDIRTFEVLALPVGVTGFCNLTGVTNNGQHYQFPGFVLAEFDPTDAHINLYHPKTLPSAGHVDVAYYRCGQEDQVSIHRYQMHEEIDFFEEDRVGHCWPDGGWHLIQTIVAIEEYLENLVGYHPKLAGLVARRFNQKAPDSAYTIVGVE